MKTKDKTETLTCLTCGESWDRKTVGFVEAYEILNETEFKTCPACQEFTE